jgi:ADP-heptose:LPS heptosyltransferase
MRILVIRTSAMGDVALTTPVLIGMRKKYPDVELVMLTRSAYRPFFSLTRGLYMFFPDFKEHHKGLSGLKRLYEEIDLQSHIDLVVDLHDVLRSKILRAYFKHNGIPVFVINKGRKEKRSVIHGKQRSGVKHSVERYCDVFARAGYPVVPSSGPWIIPSSVSAAKAGLMLGRKEELNIGVAPYAKHKLKMWPEEYMISLLKKISENYKVRFWLFGGRDESERIAALQTKIAGSVNLVGSLTLEEELAMMSRLDLMIAMDSSNMHMAALAGTKVISIWGGTDPLCGFGAWMQPENFSVRIPVDELKCRPCSIYGKGICRRRDLACMNWLTPEIVFDKIDKFVLSDHHN